MRGRAAVSIDDDLATRQSCVTIRAPDDKRTCRVHPPFRIFCNPAFGQDFGNIGFDDIANVCAGLVFMGMLCGQYD